MIKHCGYVVGIMVLMLSLSACFHEGWVKDKASVEDERQAYAQCEQQASALKAHKQQVAVEACMTRKGWERVELANENE
ncbi:hypothetical protein [Entomobacter blattae]|uniref:Lipoprotein n=1 Tax=Entomobacter blattae TaxID=2762277 RepID=A0A7H1NRD0_9PROT|nr:hypothetical protein [Entomobacter blattae]QNT78340.1 hypothetical protein JGUZn3_11130 [Entomobacter blattae]